MSAIRLSNLIDMYYMGSHKYDFIVIQLAELTVQSCVQVDRTGLFRSNTLCLPAGTRHLNEK